MQNYFTGEHIIAGNTGYLSILFSFILAIAACILNFTASGKEKNNNLLKTLARMTFTGHFIFIILAAGILYYLIFNHAFEYNYVYQYSSKQLPFQYLLSCFWAGQEGSLLIWAFFQGFLALFVMKTSGDKENPAMGIVTLAQSFLLLMLLGIKAGNIDIGSSPFTLLRNLQENHGIEFFSRPDYLSMIADGNGLNPLLQNIWMVIHPPLLFLGYSTVLIPFAYAFSGLLKKDYSGWLRPALPWALLATANLGLGIILGGAWAYVDLTFGGFWAWDPVENASLVPWLTTIASVHLILLARKYKHNLQWAFVVTGISYTLVVYASFLTRSGILKDTSAHSFGEEGKSVILVIFTLVFLAFSLVSLLLYKPKTSEQNKESLTSREFWMFIGSVILILSAFQIIMTTSIPVINKISGTHFSPPSNVRDYYNLWQVPFGILIVFITGIAQNMGYGKTNMHELTRKLAIPVIIAAVCTVIAVILTMFSSPIHYVLLFFIIITFCSSLIQMFSKKRLKKNTGAIISHAGIAVFLLGILLAFSGSNILTTAANKGITGMPAGPNHILVKGEPYIAGPYRIIYSSSESKGYYSHFNLDFYKGNETKKSFSLSPVVNKSSAMGTVYEPRIKHLLSKDVYALVVYGEGPQQNVQMARSIDPSGKEYIVVKISVFPWINILWLGAALILAGLIIMTIKRFRKNKSCSTEVVNN